MIIPLTPVAAVILGAIEILRAAGHPSKATIIVLAVIAIFCATIDLIIATVARSRVP